MTLDEAEVEVSARRIVPARVYDHRDWGVAWREKSVFCEARKNCTACRWAECKCECHAHHD